MNVTIGTDPEVFVQKGNKIVSVIGLLGGTKEEPLPVIDGAVQEDNVLAEFNIDPCFNKMEFLDRIANVRRQLNEKLGAGYTTTVKSSHTFDMEILLADRRALEFGCDPDFNCWTQEMNEPPSSESLLRTAGGHVHIGYDSPDPETSFKVAQICDIVLGLPSVLLDNDTQRREMYGKAGACRLKPYGVEYRTLSNFWLATDELQEWVFETAQQAPLQLGLLDRVLSKYSHEDIQNIINTSDVPAAASIIEEFGIGVAKSA
jgi:hypothetical protein